ncbi:type IV pilus modification protein PilV [Hydrogenophaga laconesensis]|uniref:Type IV pilus assembly protein PilV n=1 Tax=Hydrogenophaga laconesensis TaxID=1805971 RepID=A0ABU1V5V6_9BURK|nr:type IV pilus modification protein PilV [Hydrogenophaga laconesensis]MDR7092723.1 type IV pilus assembly protein PilV [Hydrogenophaga laconesensis]
MKKTHRSNHCTRRQDSRGASLIEVLVAVLILSLGLLGMAALQSRAVKGNVSSGQRAQAVMLSHYVIDVMRVDRESAKGGSYNTGSDFICNPNAFNGTSLAETSRRAWLTSVKQNIGRADDNTTCAHIACDADYACTVQIRWDDSLSGGLANQTLVISSRV